MASPPRGQWANHIQAFGGKVYDPVLSRSFAYVAGLVIDEETTKVSCNVKMSHSHIPNYNVNYRPGKEKLNS